MEAHCIFFQKFSLDVYQPKGKSNLPIYIWIHGGHFKFGSGQFYDGHKFTKSEEIVYVTIQYRLGVFGFINVKDTSYRGTFLVKNVF